VDPFRKLAKMKTLLVDDNELIRDALSLAFMNKGCFLQATATAEDGLEFFRQANVYQPNTVKVLITAYGGEDVASRASGIDVNDYIEKPFIMKKLITSLALLVEKHNAMNCNYG